MQHLLYKEVLGFRLGSYWCWLHTRQNSENKKMKYPLPLCTNKRIHMPFVLPWEQSHLFLQAHYSHLKLRTQKIPEFHGTHVLLLHTHFFTVHQFMKSLGLLTTSTNETVLWMVIGWSTVFWALEKSHRTHVVWGASLEHYCSSRRELILAQIFNAGPSLMFMAVMRWSSLSNSRAWPSISCERNSSA